jgi:hypothetical protein
VIELDGLPAVVGNFRIARDPLAGVTLLFGSESGAAAQ